MAIFDVPLEELRRRTSIKWTRWEDDVLPMFVAEMDVRTPEPIRKALSEMLDESDFGYPEQPVYEQAFADFAAWRWGWRPDVARMMPVGDVMQGMRYALEAVAAPGDRVVFNSPIYPPFREIITATGREAVDVPLVADRLDLEGLERVFRDGVKAYLLCSPHNPNGTIHTREELQRVAELAREHGVTVISDEVHAPFSGHEFTPYLDLDSVGQAITVTSAAKTFNLAGLKAALLIESDESAGTLEAMPLYVHEALSHVGATAHAAGLDQCRDWVLQIQREIRDNKDFFARLIAQRLPALRYEPSDGTYLAWLDCSALGLDDPGEFFHQQARVRCNFGREFGEEYQQFVRVNLAASPEVIDEAVRRMAEAVDAREEALRAEREAAQREAASESEGERSDEEHTTESGSSFRPPPVVASVVSNQDHHVDLDRDIIVGRSPSSANGSPDSVLLRLHSPANDISRSHLRIAPDGWKVVVTDLNSTNGTMLKPPGAPEFELRDGASAEVEVGTILTVGDQVSLRIEPPIGTSVFQRPTS